MVRLPGIREDLTPTTPAMTDRSPSPAYPLKGISLIGAPTTTTVAHLPTQPSKKNNIKPPATPRIDISRASSSSHHDSKDSSPEREIYDTHDPNSAKLGLGKIFNKENSKLLFSTPTYRYLIKGNTTR